MAAADVLVGVVAVLLALPVLKYPFTTGNQLLERCAESGLSISGVMMANELSWRTESEVRSGLLHLWEVMQECVDNGCRSTEGVLPGGLKVQRRAPRLARQLRSGMVEMNGVSRGRGSAFGGVKASGRAREGGVWGIEEFMDSKQISGWDKDA